MQSDFESTQNTTDLTVFQASKNWSFKLLCKFENGSKLYDIDESRDKIQLVGRSEQKGLYMCRLNVLP